MGKKKLSVYQIVFIAVMAAVVCVVTFFRFPLPVEVVPMAARRIMRSAAEYA